jgi:hypothetical protein
VTTTLESNVLPPLPALGAIEYIYPRLPLEGRAQGAPLLRAGVTRLEDHIVRACTAVNIKLLE